MPFQIQQTQRRQAQNIRINNVIVGAGGGRPPNPNLFIPQENPHLNLENFNREFDIIMTNTILYNFAEIMPTLNFQILNINQIPIHANITHEILNFNPIPVNNPFNEQVQIPAPDPVNKFINQPQNTHNSSVTTSISASVERLKTRYLLADDEMPIDGKISIKDAIQTVQLEIIPFLYSCRLTEIEKVTILDWFNTTYINYNEIVHGASGLNLTKILSLIWLGICDKHCMNKGVPFSENEIEDRKITLLKNIFESQKNGVCFVGNMNNIVASLEHCHPDVVIERLGTLSEIKNSANRSAADNLILYVKKSLLKKELHLINDILTHWENDENEYKIAFMNELNKDDAKELKEYLKNNLIENYEHRLDENTRNEIIQNILESSLEYLPLPEINIATTINQKLETFTNILNRIKNTNFHSLTSKKRLEPELNKRVPDHVYAIYKYCEKAISEITNLNENADNINSKLAILSYTVTEIWTELQNAKNGANWTKFNRSTPTANFYEFLNIELLNF